MDLFCALPKAELHAHLHGSIRPSTLAELVRDALGLASTAEAEDAIKSARAVSFRVFGLIYQAVCTEAVVRRITAEVVDDYASDGVDYLELRTTPRALDSTGGSDPADPDAAVERYILAVLETLAVIDARGPPAGIIVRLLLSINRASTTQAAADRLVRLAVKYAHTVFSVAADGSVSAWDTRSAPPDGGVRYGPYVVGIDLGGDPRQGSAVAFLPALFAARAAGLRVTIHAGEVMNVAETEAVLAWRPDRLGHMCVLAPVSQARLAAASSPPIPVETCPTGNSITLRLPHLRHHPTLPGWLTAGHPVAVSTDNGGVYGVRLSDELRSVATTFGLSPRAAADLAVGAFRLAFLGPPSALAGLVAAAEAKAERVLAQYGEAGAPDLRAAELPS